MNLINKYINGNVHVSIYDNGTKIREFDESPKPIHPESMDVKITNNCDGGCQFCHERSTNYGKHADLDRLLKELQVLPNGVELALGGGNILTHPGLLPFLQALKSQGIITNVTINQKHFKQYHDLIQWMITTKLVYGIGVSYSDSKYMNDIIPIMKSTNNLVFHVIAGINHINVISDLNLVCKSNDKQCKILILGYKDYGFGNKYYSNNAEEIRNNQLNWCRKIPSYFKTNNLTLSFDNLAIEQLKLKRCFTEDAWKQFYMGDEGSFTMYIDAVKQEFARCSVDSNRKSFDDIDLLSFFDGLHTSM
jgi:organic radical activating enzyme